MFSIVRLDTNEVIEGGITDGRSASQRARRHAERLGCKCQPRREPDTNWETRERVRFEQGEYTPLPWHNIGWFALHQRTLKHYAHVSKKQRDKIAFTESAEKGAADVQTLMRPGRYLKQFYSHALTDASIKQMDAEFAALFEEVELKFAKTATEIEWVYRHGPGSCMSYDRGHWSGLGTAHHPVEPYGDSDLQVAYTVKRDKRVSARAVVWPEKKIYGRVYSDGSAAAKFVTALKAAGFRDGSQLSNYGMVGARIRAIANPHVKETFVVPYIDGCNVGKLVDDNKFIELSDSTDSYDVCFGDGGYSHYYVPCPKCKRRGVKSRFYPVHTHNGITHWWCENCIGRHTFMCEGNRLDFRYPVEEAVRLNSGQLWSQEWFERFGFVCPGNKGKWSLADSIETPEGTRVSLTWYRQMVQSRLEEAMRKAREEIGVKLRKLREAA